jgi:methylenetetrahydrofolate reductase (NADPH)
MLLCRSVVPSSLVRIAEQLQEAYDAGCQNILALRGDMPRDKEQWDSPTEGGFRYAKDLVRYIRQEYGDYFGS